MSYIMTRNQHNYLVARGQAVTTQTAPQLAQIAQVNAARLQVEPVEIFIVPDNALNAYTFGLTSPNSIVLNSALFEVMDRDEIQFVLGHEMGHVRLGHTWLNSVIGGIAGVPSSFEAAMLLALAFRSWNRTCEYSADRAGMLACSRPDKAISALVKLELGASPHSQATVQRALASIEKYGDSWADDFSEIMYTHPIIAHRIRKLQEYASSTEYQGLQNRMNANV